MEPIRLNELVTATGGQHPLSVTLSDRRESKGLSEEIPRFASLTRNDKEGW